MESFEKYLSNCLNPNIKSRVLDAMNYSFLAGGKRLRPLLMFKTCECYNINPEVAFPFAAALEMIHTYSLIHDDLPAMDNDCLRRGKNTCHIEFDEATAILAGDGLLTYAFELISSVDMEPSQVIQCMRVLANCAGASGMILGQVLDIESEDKEISWEQLEQVHRFKTGKLFAAPLMIASILANQEVNLNCWEKIGEQLGLAFQLQDDILDVTKSADELGKSNSDIQNKKSTSVTILGLENTVDRLSKIYDNASYEISLLCINPTPLTDLIELIRQRQK